ncbi:MAG: hypothetical protein DCF16_06345 [Alphaproteobacteria bacterium]|nr:MAG: hypothetical protein DCF16_06345 [Alphaproteobacteria bacterium]
MRRLLAVLGWAFALVATPAFAAPDNCSRTEPSGERTMCHEAVIAAPVSEVWALFSTTEGLASWVAPVAAIDLRPGGMWESSYDRAARLGDAGNIRNRVIAITPERSLIIQVAGAPPNFPHADLVGELVTVIAFEPVDAANTRVRVTMLGYRDGEGFDALYRHFEWGNAYTLDALAARVSAGPTDWSAAQ